ncbi:MAG: hypothetical protein CMI79_00785 [Candidatus Pelagibacter sp.]|nr:hypothetical protein [Candidatus Pelagibacter sp.]|tara:strand:- start:5533 stop:6666 length:1134 start_codon:yes stop_codon:yes gene_type:complete
MIIGIISRSNLDDKIFWSGTANTIYSNLKSKNNIKTVKIDNLNNLLRKVYAIRREYLKFIKNIKYDEAYNETISKNFSRQIENRLKDIEVDYLLTFDISLISHLKTKIPILLWTDTLYTDYYEHYFKEKNISKETNKNIKILEKKTIKKCYKVFLSSIWAINKAKKKYKKFSEKFHHLNLGPNFNVKITDKTISRKLKIRPKCRINLITLSVKWKRKGLDKVLKLNETINRKGIKSYLTVIGLKNKKFNDKRVKFVGFINKNDPSGEKIISNHLLKNHFHILFSESEAYGLALIEANSRAVPNITFNVGGISHIIKDNLNGKAFNQNEDINNIANYIIETFKNKKKYEKLALSSRREYLLKYDYDKIISKFIYLIKK